MNDSIIEPPENPSIFIKDDKDFIYSDYEAWLQMVDRTRDYILDTEEYNLWLSSFFEKVVEGEGNE